MASQLSQEQTNLVKLLTVTVIMAVLETSWEQEYYKSFTAVSLAVKVAAGNGHPAVTEMAKIHTAVIKTVTGAKSFIVLVPGHRLLLLSWKMNGS